MTYKKNLPSILLILSLFFSLYIPAQKSEIDLANKLLDSARVLSVSSKYIDAINVNKSALLKLNKENINDSIIAKIYSNIGSDYINVRSIDSARIYINEGLKFLKEREVDNSREKGLLYYSLGTVYAIIGDLDNGEKYFNEALKVQLNSIGENHYETAATYSNLGNIYLYKRDLNKVNDYFNKAIKITQNTLGENHQKMSGYYNNLGIAYSIKGEYKRALVNYEKSVQITKNNYGSDYIKLNQPYYNLSSLYHQLWDFDKAIDYMLKSIRLKEKIYETKGYELGDAYTVLALQYSEINKFEEAIISLDKGLGYLRKTYDENHESIAINHANKSAIYKKMNKNNEAIEYGLKALTILNKLPHKNYPEIISVNSNLSKAYINTGDYTKATEHSIKALAVFEIEDINDKADIYLNLAKISILKNEDNLNEKYLDTASRHIGYSVSEPENFNRIQDFDAFSYFFKLKLLRFKKKLQVSKDPKYSDSLKITYSTFLNFQDFIYQKFSRRENKNFRIDQSHFLYEESISNIIDRKKDDELMIAFEEAEKVKSRLLLENLNKQNAQKFVNINDSLLIKEYDLEKKLSQLEEKEFNLKSSDSILISIKNEIFEVKTAQDELQKIIKTKHPDYYNLVYDHNVVNVKEIQELLNQDQSLIEYFVGKQSIFIFLITKDKYIVKQVAKDFPLKEWVNEMREGIYGYWAQPDNKDSDIVINSTLYKKTAYHLYGKLINPIVNDLTKELIIIPDAELNFIPFDALLTNDSQDTSNSKKLPYLIKKRQISYNYSATLYKQLIEKNESQASNNLIAFAPSFKENSKENQSLAMQRNGLGELKYNITEATTISNLFDGSLFKESNATKSNFINNVKDYKIIHLSTHAKSNDNFGDYSYIAFSKSRDTLNPNEKLYVSELYNLDLDADMVVLSACETGLGELRKGEGIISLASGFTYAGAKSTLTSLWNVNDSQTTTLMNLFYSNLKKGMTKAKALHEAKLSYIENENLNAPYFWASFIPSGNMEAIQLESNNKYYYIFIGSLSIFIFIWYRFRKKKRNPYQN